MSALEGILSGTNFTRDGW